jgi:hypothetical protein
MLSLFYSDVLSCLFLLCTSGRVVYLILKLYKLNDVIKCFEKPEKKAIGSLIGKCENILIFIFIIMEGYTGTAIILTAKIIAREGAFPKKRNDENDHLNDAFVLGTLINYTYSVVIGLTAVGLKSLF